jgi:outer membrane receptor protein involved in Fe transport
MKKSFLLTCVGFALSGIVAMAQSKVSGNVYDGDQGNEPMIGVTVSYEVDGVKKGVATDFDGHYEFSVKDGAYTLTFSYMGYQTQQINCLVERKKDFVQDVVMHGESSELDAVVVSAGRFEQKLSDLTVSMNVLKAADVTKQSPSDLRSTLNNLSGVDVQDKQPSIRGGSGWTYGVGSRCLIMVDGMSILSPAGGEINWNAIPMENIAQVEVMKGASSVLYGSSALNGLINVRTARPSLDPETRVNIYMGVYADPQNEDYRWWSKEFWKEGDYEVEPLLRKTVFSGIRNPINNGIDISHTRRIGDWDLSAAVNLFNDEGFKKGGYNRRVRGGVNAMYYSPKIKGLKAGVNANLLSSEAADVFLWRSSSSPYEQSPLSNMARQTNEFYIDPTVSYYNRDNGTTHTVKARFYTSYSNIQTNPTDKSLTEILGNMGVDYDKISNDVLKMKELMDQMREQALAAGQADPFDFSDIDFSASTDDIISQVTNKIGTIQSIIDGMVDPVIPGVSSLVPLIANLGMLDRSNPLTKEQISNAVATLKEIGTTYFPNADHSDFVDLIGWVMGQEIPADMNSGVDYLLNTLLNNGQQTPKKLNRADRADAYYLDYQFSKNFGSDNTLTAGATYEHVYSNAETSGVHNSDNAALYIQYDDKFFDRLNLSIGARFEYYRVDDKLKEANFDLFGVNIPVRPVLRGGLNYQLGKASFLRASYGQGYRYPSITEKYVRKDIGGIGAYPNHNLRPESGYNVELGFKQGYKFGPFKGFIDIAAFYTEYKDMIEFNIGLFDNNSYNQILSMYDLMESLMNGSSIGIGAQFFNVDKARIYGAEVNLTGICEINSHSNITYNIGYVYTEPEDVNYKAINEREESYVDPLQMKMKSNNSKYLKYRQKHTFKASLDWKWRRLSIGTNIIYKSKTLAVDYFMVDERQKDMPDAMDYVRDMLFGDLAGYWESHNTGYVVWDLRAGVEITKKIKLNAIVNNVLNAEYSTRPMDVSAPRTYTFQMDFRF